MGRGIDIEQFYTPYWTWECYKAGMWNTVEKDLEPEMFSKALDFTSDYIKYGKAMMEVKDVWQNSCLNFLTNRSINRKAYIGHCAVFYKLQIPEYIVRKAWKHLSELQQIRANNEAKKAIEEWEKEYMKKLNNTLKLGRKDVIQMEFPM